VTASANLDLVRAIYAAWERGDFRSTEWAHPEIEYVEVEGLDAGSYTGLGAMTQRVGEGISPFVGFRVEAEEYRELDEERVLVLVHWGGRGRMSGVELGQTQSKAASLFHVRDDKVTRLVIYYDRERALADLGLTPEGDSA
jgi:ketosteroid isomerase-like protein